MPPKIILNTNDPNYKPPSKRRDVAKEVDMSWTVEYWRDRVIWKLFPESRKEIEERYNLK